MKIKFVFVVLLACLTHVATFAQGDFASNFANDPDNQAFMLFSMQSHIDTNGETISGDSYCESEGMWCRLCLTDRAFYVVYNKDDPESTGSKLFYIRIPLSDVLAVKRTAVNELYIIEKSHYFHRFVFSFNLKNFGTLGQRLLFSNVKDKTDTFSLVDSSLVVAKTLKREFDTLPVGVRARESHVPFSKKQVLQVLNLKNSDISVQLKDSVNGKIFGVETISGYDIDDFGSRQVGRNFDVGDILELSIPASRGSYLKCSFEKDRFGDTKVKCQPFFPQVKSVVPSVWSDVSDDFNLTDEMYPVSVNEKLSKVFDDAVLADWNGESNLYSEKDYEDFVLRFEYLMSENGNGGVGLRLTDLDRDAAYYGMGEIQLLDDGGSSYYDHVNDKPKLHPYQYTGSLYGVTAAKRDNVNKQAWGQGVKFSDVGSYARNAGMWNFVEVSAIGDHLQVMLNGIMVTDVDVSHFKGNGDTPDGRKHPGLHNWKGKIALLGQKSGVRFRNVRIKEVSIPPPGVKEEKACPFGSESLFTGERARRKLDLQNWKGVTTEFTPPAVCPGAADKEKRCSMLKIRQNWEVRNGVLFFDGFSSFDLLETMKDYGDFIIWVDWRLLSCRGDSGLYLRGCPQVLIWDAHDQRKIGSGGLSCNSVGSSRADKIADRPIGDWNRMCVRMVGEKVSVWLNGELVVNNVVMENYWDRMRSIPSVGPIGLQCHNAPVEWNNIFIKEL